jgi:hypothetical protein
LEKSTEYPGAAIGLGGATPQELKLATETKGKLNARIMAHRDHDLPWLRACEAYERHELDLDVLIGPRATAHEAYVRQVLSSPRKKPIDIGSRGPAAVLHTRSTPQKLAAAFLSSMRYTSNLVGDYMLWRERLPALRLRKLTVVRKPFHRTARYEAYLSARAAELRQWIEISWGRGLN